MLPSWVRTTTKDSPVTIRYDVADSPWTAPGYRLVGRDFYTCVEPVDRIADRAVVAWLRTFCPDVVPIWRKQTYLPPGGTEAFTAVHLGIARCVRDPRGPLHVPYVEMPANARHQMPNLLVRIFEDHECTTVLHEGGPGPYEPLDMGKYRELRADYNETQTTDEILDERFRVADEEAERRRVFELGEWEYRRKHLDAFIKKQLEAPGDTLSAWRQYRRMKRQMALDAMKRMGLRPMQGVQ